MPLPMSKGELNRLGDRLIAGERASDVDLADLAVALAAYQEVLASGFRLGLALGTRSNEKSAFDLE
jgi:hypothetical protein